MGSLTLYELRKQLQLLNINHNYGDKAKGFMEQFSNIFISLGYDEKLMRKEDFFEMFGDGPPNMLYINITSWLSSQLVHFSDVENSISPVEDEDEEDSYMKSIAFKIELSSLLKELNCPLKRVIYGPLESRLNNIEDQARTLVFLTNELQAAKMIFAKKPSKPANRKIELSESRTAKEVKEMLITLNFGKPPDNISPQQLFGEVDKKINALSQPFTPKEFIKELLFTGYLSEKQWFQINDLYREMFQEYHTRRHLLVARLEVTIESFMWSGRLKIKGEEIQNLFNKLRKDLHEYPEVKISDILAASTDLVVIEKTSNSNVRKNTKSSVNKVMIGAVPDRGGRPEEQQPPPPEIPSWQKSDTSSRGGFRSSDKPKQGGNSYQMDGQRQFNSSNQSDNQRRDQHYSQGNKGYSQGNKGYSQGNKGYSQGNKGYSQGNVGYSQGNVGYKSRDQNSYQRDMESTTPGYQNPYMAIGYQQMIPVEMINTPIPPQFGFGGYGPTPAGDHFAQFGNNQASQIGGDGTRQRGRGGGNFRGGRSRGNARGRNHY